MPPEIKKEHLIVAGVLLLILTGGWLYFSDLRKTFDLNQDTFYIIEDRIADNGQLRITTRGFDYENTKELLLWRYDEDKMTLYKNNKILIRSQWLVKGYKLKREGTDVLSYEGDENEDLVNIFRNRSYNNGFFTETTLIDSEATYEQFPAKHSVSFTPKNDYKHALTWRLDRIKFPDSLEHGRYYGCEINTTNNVKINWCNDIREMNYAFIDKTRDRLSVYFNYAKGIQHFEVYVTDPPTDYIIIGDSVIQEDVFSSLKVTPHTILGFNSKNLEQEFEIKNKTLVDVNNTHLAVVFDTSLESGDFFIWNYDYSYDWVEQSNICNQDYNYTLNKFSGERNPHEATCYRYVDSNQTYEIQWVKQFKSADVPNKEIFFDVNTLISSPHWESKKQLINHVVLGGKHIYYVNQDVAFKSQQTRKVKFVFTPSEDSGKYIAIYYVGEIDCILDNSCIYQQRMDPWFEPATFESRYALDVGADHSDLNTTYTHRMLNMDMSSWSCADSNSLAVVYEATGVEIDAVIEGICGVTTDANIFWGAQTGIPDGVALPASDTNGYRVYVSTSTRASPLRDCDNVYLICENCEALNTGNLNGQNGWSGDVTFDVISGVSCSGGAGQCIRAEGDDTDDMIIRKFKDLGSIVKGVLKVDQRLDGAGYGTSKIQIDGTEECRIPYLRGTGSVDMGIFGGTTTTFTENTPNGSWRSFNSNFDSADINSTILNSSNPETVSHTDCTWTTVDELELNMIDTTTSGEFVYFDNIVLYEDVQKIPVYTLGPEELNTEVPDLNVATPTVTGITLKGGEAYTIDLNVFDADTNAVDQLFDINYSSSPNQGTGTVIINDGNVATTAGLFCDTNNLSSPTQCHYTLWNTTGLDGNFFILAFITADSENDFDASDNNFLVDSTAPTTIADNNITWQNVDANITLTCTDGTGSGCNLTQYRIDSDDTNTISFGTWQVWDGNGLWFGADGNFAFDFNSTDNVGNTEATNRSFVTIDKTIPVLSDAQPSSNQNTGDSTPDLNVAFSETHPWFCTVTPIVNDVNQSDVNATLSSGRCLYTSSALNDGDTIKSAFVMTDLAGNTSSELQTAIYTIIGDTVFGNVNENYVTDVNGPEFSPSSLVDFNSTPFGQNDTNGFWRLENVIAGDINLFVIMRNRRVLDNFEQNWYKYKRVPLTDALLSVSTNNSYKGTYALNLRVDADLNFTDNNNLSVWINNQFTWDINSEYNQGSDLEFWIKITDVSQVEDINIIIGNNLNNHVWLDLNQTADSNLTNNVWFRFDYDLNLAINNQVGTVNWADLNYISVQIIGTNDGSDFNMYIDDLIVTPSDNPINNWGNGTSFCVDDDNSITGCLDLNISSPALVIPTISNGETKDVWIWGDFNLMGFTPFDLFEFDFNFGIGDVPNAN